MKKSNVASCHLVCEKHSRHTDNQPRYLSIPQKRPVEDRQIVDEFPGTRTGTTEFGDKSVGSPRCTVGVEVAKALEQSSFLARYAGECVYFGNFHCIL